MQENHTTFVSTPIGKASVITTKSEINEKVLPSGSKLLAIPSEHLCPKCKDIKALTKESRKEEASKIQEASLEEFNRDLRGTESTDTIVAFPQNSQANEPKKFIFVSDILNNMALDKSIESIHELKPKKEKRMSSVSQNCPRCSALEHALKCSSKERLSYFDNEGFKMYDLKIVTSLTDLDTLKTDEASPRVSFLLQESVSLIYLTVFRNSKI